MDEVRLKWAIRQKIDWPTIQSVEGITLEEYRKVKREVRKEDRAKCPRCGHVRTSGR